MLQLIKNARLWDPQPKGVVDLLVAFGRIVEVGQNLKPSGLSLRVWDLEGRTVTPGLIDQHVHIAGAGGNQGFSSLTREVQAEELWSTGTTTVVGLMGTEGLLRSLSAVYSKVMALREEGMSAYMYSGYYGIDSTHLTGSVQSDMVFIEPVLGCKVAISDTRSSFPTDIELARLLRQVLLGGATARKKGILHVHLGIFPSKLEPLMRLVRDFSFPIQHISPTHTNRNLDLFEEAMAFAQSGGRIDLTTGASRFEDPSKSFVRAIEAGLDSDLLTFSSDGHAGLSATVAAKNGVELCAPLTHNLREMIKIHTVEGLGLDMALKPVTTGPAMNLGLNHKGRLEKGFDADLCVFDQEWNLTGVMGCGIWKYDPFGSYVLDPSVIL
ncbi:MAG: amidohydrolase family protein [Bacteroidia bacterium]